jgi:tetratricopeptide (TPR) repeat protein
MKRRSFLITLCFCGQCLSACGQAAHSSQTEAEQAGDKQAHKVVQVDWRAQLAATQKQLEREPNSGFLHGQAAVAYDALGDFDSFEREIQTAMRLDPGNSMPCYMAYAVYKRKHLKDKQTSVLDAALKIDPANPFGRYEKAGMLEDAKEWQSALKEYETVQGLLQRVKSEPNNFQNNGWRYVDARGNPYDVTLEESQIADDISRVRGTIQGRK